MSIDRFNKEPEYINDFSLSLLESHYLSEGESVDRALARAATAFSFGDSDLAQRIYEAAWKGWFMFSSPILSNAPSNPRWMFDIDSSQWQDRAEDISLPPLIENLVSDDNRGLPISCFGTYVEDTIDGQIEMLKEIADLSVSGGGVGIHNGIRAVSNKAPGPIPFMKVVDSEIGYFRQGKSRRGACVYYLDVDHPDIIEHIRFRVPTGGDPKRKGDNLTQFHNGVNITREFVQAVLNDDEFQLKCPHTKELRDTVRARSIWEEILSVRALTGEPYIIMIDNANDALPQAQKDLGLSIKSSNLCSEIYLPTDSERTFVCCLSSLNLEKYDEWKDTSLVADLVRYLDNVIQFFIEKAGPGLHKAKYSAWRERALGIGTMGWHRYLQSKGIPFESGGVNSAISHTHSIFKDIKTKAVEASEKLAIERGEAPDMMGTGRRNSHLLAVAPNANSALILGTSASIEPESGVVFVQNTRAGTTTIKNPYFTKLLNSKAEELGKDDVWIDKQWNSIITNDGSVQHLDFLSDEEKDLFKTAYEMDQHWLIEQAEVRQNHICQGQSLNLFFPAGVNRSYYNSVHLKAATSDIIKGLYYSRSKTGVNPSIVKEIEVKTFTDWAGDDCVACQG